MLLKQHTDLLTEASVSNAIAYGITVYDSLYVTLALNTNSKLVSFDKDLKEKLEK